MRRLALVLVAVLALAGCQHRAEPAFKPTTTTTTTTLLAGDTGHPRPAVTPGIVLTTRAADVCTSGWATKHRRGLTAKQKAGVLRAYGYPVGQKVAEWDHLVSLELGGGNGTKNIFPMVDAAQAQRKDHLENRLHDTVCEGRLALAEAQAEIRQFWLWW